MLSLGGLNPTAVNGLGSMPNLATVCSKQKSVSKEEWTIIAWKKVLTTTLHFSESLSAMLL